MRNLILLLFMVCFTACQTTKIKDDCYKVSASLTELGSIGQSKSMFNLKNSFEVRTLPKLENKIRLAASIIPYNKNLDKFYKAKAEFNQKQSKVNYIDSLPEKPELVTFRIMDVTGLVNELNTDYNNDVFRLLMNTQKAKIVTSVAVNLSPENLVKLRLADAFYLENREDKKYNVVLYKQGKKIDFIDINSETVIAYRLSSFCWGLTDRGKWYVADLYEGKGKCKGNMKKKVSEKQKAKSLYDM